MAYRAKLKTKPLERFAAWAAAEEEAEDRFDPEQKVLIGFALQFADFAASIPILNRLTVYFLSHCGAGLSPVTIGEICDRSREAVHDTKRLSPKQFVASLRKWGFGKRGPAPKLGEDHVVPIAAFLSENPRAGNVDIAKFLYERFGVEVAPFDGALAKLLRRFGMDRLKKTA